MTEKPTTPRCCSQLTPREGIDLHEIESDPAMESLSNALRMTFRLLSFLMVVFVILFLSTGIARVKPQQKGVLKCFGRVVGVVDEGLAFNWPFPIGEIELVRTDEQRIKVNDFWMFESERDKKQPLAERRRNTTSLRPGFDGYLFTSDRNIIHIRFQVGYRVIDPQAYVSTVTDPRRMVHLAVRQATIEAAATRTAFGIVTKVEGFRTAIIKRAQEILNAQMGGKRKDDPTVRITTLVIPGEGLTWPLAAYTAYEQAVAAGAKKRETIKTAIGAANAQAEIIGNVAFVQLCGEPWETQKTIARRTDASASWLTKAAIGKGPNPQPAELAPWSGKYNLLGQYLALQGRGATAKTTPRLTHLYGQIVDLLRSDTAGGVVRKIIAQAEADKSKTVQTARSRADRVERLYAADPQARAILIERMWLNTLDEVLAYPTVSKYLFPEGSNQPVIIQLNRDPGVEKNIRNYIRKQASARANAGGE